MALMLPTYISNEVSSSAEKKIFQLFQSTPKTEDWIVLHSLGLSEHITQTYGEIDFLVIAPNYGVFVIEVKGGRVKRENGIWTFTDRYGKTSQRSKGPFEQARDAMYSLRNYVTKNNGNINVPSILFGYGVMFPDIEFDDSSCEFSRAQVFDRNTHNLRDYIFQLSEYFKSNQKNRLFDRPLSNIQATSLMTLLRGDFDKKILLSVGIENIERQLISLTAEQYKVLDLLEDNSRLIVKGYAGTGKTLLAIESARKYALNGESVALFCFNSKLAKWFQSIFESLNLIERPAYIGTLHAFFEQESGKNGIPLTKYRNTEGYFDDLLPKMAIQAQKSSGTVFDRIIIDEGQDIVKKEYVEALSSFVRKGMTRGKWIIFGDFSAQSIYTTASAEEMYKIIDPENVIPKVTLKSNCRNTKQIGKEILNLSEFQEAYYFINEIVGEKVDFILYQDKQIQKEKLENLLKRLFEERVPPEKITILSENKWANSIVANISEYKIVEQFPGAKGNITFSTIQSFKGLENSVIIIIDVESYSHDKLMYVGYSRARSILYVFESENARAERIVALARKI